MRNEIKIDKFDSTVDQTVKQAMLAFSAQIAYEMSGEKFLLDLAKDFEKQISENLGIKPDDFKAVKNTKNISASDAKKYYREYFIKILSAQTEDKLEAVMGEDKNIFADKNIQSSEVPKEKINEPIVVSNDEVKKVVKEKNIVTIADINNNVCIATALKNISDFEKTEITFNANFKDVGRLLTVLKAIMKKYGDKIKNYSVTWDEMNNQKDWLQVKKLAGSMGVTITDKIAA